MQVTYRKTCRVCGSSALTKVIDLGEQYLQGSFVKPGKQMPPMFKIPTTLVRCDTTQNTRGCGLLQMAGTVSPETLYSVYWYRSGTNQTMRDHLRGIVEEAVAMIGRKPARVLDIGCNDGTLLNYYPDNFVRFGIDPSDIAQTITGKIHVVQGFFPSEELAQMTGGMPFEIITSIAMFYDLEDPVGFVRHIKKSLAPQGLWVFEMSYMPSMLKMNSYDTICHEHLEYYSLDSLEYILRQGEMRLLKVSLNDINGGSIRCYATHAAPAAVDAHESSASWRALRLEERAMRLDTEQPYRSFQERINRHKRELTTLLAALKKQGKTIHIYGASTKGNTILQFCGIDHSVIDAAADRNPEKHGARTLGTDIPVISEEESRAMRPDYYLVLPWHFKREFLARERETLDRGVGMIFPLPVVEVVKR